MVHSKGASEVVHPSSSFLYDIAVEVSGVQDEQGCGLDQVRVGCWSLGSLMVVACPSPTAGCAAHGQFVNVVLVRSQRSARLLSSSQLTHEAALDVVDLADLKRRELELS